MEMTADDRRRLGRRLLDEQNSERFGGVAQNAYLAAGVSQMTWANVVSGKSTKDHTIRRIVVKLWPEAKGDWRRIPGLDAPTDDLEALLAERYAAGYAAGMEAARSDTPESQESRGSA